MSDASRLNARAVRFKHLNTFSSGGTPAQTSIFDPEQQEHVERVGGAIGRTIIGFLRARLNNGMTEFCADDLRSWVAARHPGAPASADRILRHLRQRGFVTYYVINRAKSLYRLVSIT